MLTKLRFHRFFPDWVIGACPAPSLPHAETYAAMPHSAIAISGIALHESGLRVTGILLNIARARTIYPAVSNVESLFSHSNA